MKNKLVKIKDQQTKEDIEFEFNESAAKYEYLAKMSRPSAEMKAAQDILDRRFGIKI
jgi:hypothetical protein